MHRGERHYFVFVLVVGSLLLLLQSCAGIQRAYHESYMKGSIIEKEGSSVYLCIGKKDGAKVGQELEVYRIRTIMIPKLPTRFERELVGKIRITEVVDEHFARADVISGPVQKNDIASLGW